MNIKDVYERYKHLDDAKIFDLDVEAMDFIRLKQFSFITKDLWQAIKEEMETPHNDYAKGYNAGQKDGYENCYRTYQLIRFVDDKDDRVKY